MSAAKPLPSEQGEIYESLVAEYFVAKGYRIVTRNYRAKLGEVDLIVERDETLAFVEVRYRRYDTFGSPEETVDRGKRRRVIRAAVYFAAENRIRNRNFRFDVVAVRQSRQGPHIEHIVGAFDADLGPGTTLVI